MGALQSSAWERLVEAQSGVVSREQALALGVGPDGWHQLCTRAGHQLVLPGVLLLSRAAPDERQQQWAAVRYAGRGAALDGLAALRTAGLRLSARQVDIAVPTGRRVVAQPSAATRRARLEAEQRERQRRERGDRPLVDPVDLRAYQHRLVVVPHQVEGLDARLDPTGQPPRVRAAVAALHGAAWARSDAEAETVLAVVAQQRLATPRQLQEELAALPRLRRRALLREVTEELQHGVQARGELLFLRQVRRAGLPPPDRLQHLVRTGTGRRYLDAWWEAVRMSVELDGAHHRDVETWEADLVRANDVGLAHRQDRLLLLRFTTRLLRHEEPLVLRQLRGAFR